MKIGLTFDLRSYYLEKGFSEEDAAEFDSEETISCLQKAIESFGHTVERVGTASQLCEQLAAGRRWDMIFNIAEGIGGRCRESQVPAILETYRIPHTFSDALVCALTLDKAMAKRIILHHNLATPAFAVIQAETEIEKLRMTYPLFAKPLAEGTGKGIDGNSKITNKSEAEQVCMKLIEKYKQPVLVEEFLPGREFTVGILGTDNQAKVLGVMEIEIIKGNEPAIYSFTNKEECETRVVYHPLDDDPALKEKVETLALKCYQALECRDAGRVDITCDEKGEPFFMEVNPLPGLHPFHSDLPMIATQEGMPYETLIGTIIDNAIARHK